MGPDVPPEQEPLLHVTDEHIGEVGAGDEQPPTDHEPARPLGRDVQHDQEQAEEQQARAEVVLEDQDPEADQPHRQDRAEVATTWEVDHGDPAAGERQRIAVEDEIAGERHHQQHLGDLAGLEAHRADVDPDPRAVDGLADDRSHRQEKQHDRGEPTGVGEPLEHPVVAQDHQGRDEQPDAEGHPDQLLSGELGVAGEVDPMDDREPDAVERGHDRQQHGIGVRRDHAHGDVGGDDQGGEPPAVGHDVGGHLALHAEPDACVGPDPDHEGEHEQEQLGAASAAVDELHEGPGLGGALGHVSPPPSCWVPGGRPAAAPCARRRRGCSRRCRPGPTRRRTGRAGLPARCWSRRRATG